MKITVFEQVGGFARVRLIVSDLYDRILESDRLRPYFEHIDMRRMIDHQTKFVSALMGGPASFTNEQLSRSHQRLRIGEEDFQEMADLFRETLEDFGVDRPDADRLYAHMLSLREYILGRATTEAQ